LTASVTIAKLEALLARVLARSAEKRPSPPVALAETAVPLSPPPPAVVAAPAVVVAPAVELDVEDKPTIPPAPMRASLDEPDVDISPAVEVTVDNGPDIVVGESSAVDELLLDAVSDSRERLVAADPVDAAGASVIAEVEEVEEEEDAAEDVQEEEAPASSRRPVAPAPEERLAELAFGTEEQPAAGRTPPPKSGPLPAPPLDFDADVTGVRKSVPPGADSSESPAPARLTPQVARLQVSEGRDPIVDVIGAAQRFAPPTFTSLLDASLSL
jgi:hypothetical protein